jgi:hypothetical protein
MHVYTSQWLGSSLARFRTKQQQPYSISKQSNVIECGGKYIFWICCPLQLYIVGTSHYMETEQNTSLLIDHHNYNKQQDSPNEQNQIAP